MENEPRPENKYDRQSPEQSATGHEDVLLDVPALHVDSLDLDVSDLRARVSLQAEVLSLFRLNVGIDADLGQAHLGLRGVDAKALLKVRLENVASILDRVLHLLDSHPEIVEPLVRADQSAARRSVGSDPARPLANTGGEGVLPATLRAAEETARTAAEAGPETARTAQQSARNAGQPTRPPATTSAPDAQGRNESDVAGRATADAGSDTESRHPEQDSAEENSRTGSERRYRGLPRRIRRRW